LVTESEGSSKPTQQSNATFDKYLLSQSPYLDFVHRLKVFKTFRITTFRIPALLPSSGETHKWQCLTHHRPSKPCSAELDRDLVPNKSQTQGNKFLA